MPQEKCRVAFRLSFDPPLPYPSSEAYALLWVNDHLLFPRNTTQGLIMHDYVCYYVMRMHCSHHMFSQHKA